MLPRILRTVPPALVALRVALGPLILLGVARQWSGATLVAALAAGVLSDIFDGIIARRLGTATPALRQADSAADVVFWLCVLFATDERNGGFLMRHAALLGAFLLSELICQAVSFARFRRPLATHTYAAKLWGLLLFAGFAMLLMPVRADGYADFTFAFGIAVNVEVFAIIVLSHDRPIDMPSLLTLLRQRRMRAT